jgi:hypothetical protein
MSFLYGFKGTPSGRASRAEARPRERARGNAKSSRRGCVNRRAGRAQGAGRVGGATVRPWGGSQPRPSGWGAYGRGTAARPGRPAPAGRRSPPLRSSDDRAARAPGRAVLHAPRSLSPRKLTLKGATCGRVLRTAALRTALDRELPRQDLGHLSGGRWSLRNKTYRHRLFSLPKIISRRRLRRG